MAFQPKDQQMLELSYSSQEQLVESCVLLHSRMQMMEILLTEYYNEKSKLQAHQKMLKERIARMKGSSEAGSHTCDDKLAATASKISGQMGSSDTPSATYDMTGMACPQATTAPVMAQIVSTPVSRLPCATVVQDSTELVQDAPSNAVPVLWTTTNSTPVTSELDRTWGTVASMSESVAASYSANGIASAVQERLSATQQLSAPEELLLRVSPTGTVRLTWFYDEHILEQLANPQHPLRRICFEVRQQSEGVNGRMRARTHICECSVLGKGEEVGEQSFEVQGCVPGRAYGFSVRAQAEFHGQARPVYSAYSEVVPLGAFSPQCGADTASNYEAQSTAVSTPRTISAINEPHAGTASLIKQADLLNERILKSESTMKVEQKPQETWEMMCPEKENCVDPEGETHCPNGMMHSQEHANEQEDIQKTGMFSQMPLDTPVAGGDSAQVNDTLKGSDECEDKRKIDEEVQRRVNDEKQRLEREVWESKQQLEQQMQRQLADQAAQRASELERLRTEASLAFQKRLAEERQLLAEEALMTQEDTRKHLEEQMLEALQQQENNKLQQQHEAFLEKEKQYHKLAEDAKRSEEEAKAKVKALEEEKKKQAEAAEQAMIEMRMKEDAWKQEAREAQLQEEAARQASEAERIRAVEKARQAQEAEKKREEEERRRQVEESLRKQAQEEMERRLAEEAARRKKEEEEEEERRRKEEEQEEERRRKEQEERRRKEEEEERRRKEEEEERRRLEEELAKERERIAVAQEAERRRREEEEEKEENLKRLAAEAERHAAEARQQAEQEAKRQAEVEIQSLKEALQKKKVEEERQLRIAEEARIAEEEARRRRLDEERQRRFEEEVRKRVEEEARKWAEEAYRKEEDSRKRQQQEEQRIIAQQQAEELLQRQKLEEDIRSRALAAARTQVDGVAKRIDQDRPAYDVHRTRDMQSVAGKYCHEEMLQLSETHDGIQLAQNNFKPQASNEVLNTGPIADGNRTSETDVSSGSSTLHVRILAAHYIHKSPGATTGLSELYVIARLGNIEKRTLRTCHETGAVWHSNNEFTFAVGDADSLLELEVMSAQPLEDSCCGRTCLGFWSLVPSQWQHRRERLKESGEGEIEFEVCFNCSSKVQQQWATREVQKRVAEMERRIKEQRTFEKTPEMVVAQELQGATAPPQSSFAMGFAKYCQSKAPAGEKSGATSPGPHAMSMTASMRSQRGRGRSPVSLASAPRSPMGIHTPIDGADGSDKMDRWMSKILAEKGPPPMALAAQAMELKSPTSAPVSSTSSQAQASESLDQTRVRLQHVRGPGLSQQQLLPHQRRMQQQQQQQQQSQSKSKPTSISSKQEEGKGKALSRSVAAPSKPSPAGITLGGSSPSSAVPQIVPTNSDGLGPTVMKLPKRATPVSLEMGAANRISEMTRALDPRQGPSPSGATSPLSGSIHCQVEKGPASVPRSLTFAAHGGTPGVPKTLAQAAAASTQVGTSPGVARCSSFSVYSSINVPTTTTAGYPNTSHGSISQQTQQFKQTVQQRQPHHQHHQQHQQHQQQHQQQQQQQQQQQPQQQQQQTQQRSRGVGVQQRPAHSSLSPQPPTRMPSQQGSSGWRAQANPLTATVQPHQMPLAQPKAATIAQSPVPAQAAPLQGTVQAVVPCAGPLEVSQRMARANDLQHRLSSNKASGSQVPFHLNTPSLLNWAKESQHGQQTPSQFPALHAIPDHPETSNFEESDPFGLGLSTLHNLPPPPRSAPAAASSPGLAGCRGGPSSNSTCSGGSLCVLKVLTSDSKWETLSFSSTDCLEQQCSIFLKQHSLKSAFHSGLLAKMQSMVASGQSTSSVDIVDLI